MWLRLSYMSLAQGIKPQKIGGYWQGAAVSGRQKSVLRKTFLTHGVPWIYEPEIENQKNPRNKAPKGHKTTKLREERVDNIKKNLSVSREQIKEHLQAQLNKRPLKGFDKMVNQGLTSYYKARDKNSNEEKQKKSIMKSLNRGVDEVPASSGENFEF